MFFLNAKKSTEHSRRGKNSNLNFDLSVPPSDSLFLHTSFSPLLVLWIRENLAAEVYKDMPETSFTRTISNPEVVMKRRRQQKLEKRMQEFMSSDGRPDSGASHNLKRSCLQVCSLNPSMSSDYTRVPVITGLVVHRSSHDEAFTHSLQAGITLFAFVLKANLI